MSIGYCSLMLYSYAVPFGLTRQSGNSSILLFRRCVADRRLSGVERNFSARYSRERKCEKAQSFAISHDRGPGTKRVVTAKPSSLDATPASTIVAGRRANPARGALSPTWHHRLNPEAAN